MTKTIDELTNEELLAEVKRREEEKYKLERAAAEKARRAEKKKISRIEKLFQETRKALRTDLEEAHKLKAEAGRIAVAVAEKHGIPVDWDDGVYVPTTIGKWSETDFNEEERKWAHEKLYDEFYAALNQANPGEWWEPSQVC